MKSLTDLTRVVLQDCGTALGTSTTHDLKTVMSRSQTEGDSFLTITLPSFEKQFISAISKGRISPSDFPAFKRAGGSARLPAFLQGFTELVFDRKSGLLLDNPSTEAVWCVRQICLLHSKLFEQSTSKRRKRALKAFVECEQEVKKLDEAGECRFDSAFGRISSLLFRDIFSDLDSLLWNLDEEIIPRFGPGATAEKFSANGRWRDAQWTKRLEEVFPAAVFRLPSEKYYSELDRINFFEPDAEPPVRVITVPKTKKTPRIIAIEPAHQMMMQQALMHLIVPRIEASPLVGSMIGFTDQEPNQELACAGSISGDLATLDLSEASDRVSFRHVRNLLTRHSQLLKAVSACRSLRADVPGHGVVHLSKFASMGSALTFPMEAMVFLTAVFVGIELELSRPLTRKDISSMRGKVRVYGDDIIIPVEYVRSVIAVFDAFGFKVNADKSFWIGSFRESCGKEYYNGTDVSVTKLRRRIPQSRKDVAELVSYVSFRNQCYWKGMWDTCRKLDKDLDRLLGGHFPIVESTSPALGRESVLQPEAERQDPKLQSDQVKAWVKRDARKSDPLEGMPALWKCLSLMERRETAYQAAIPQSGGEEHLERSGRPEKTVLTLRWCSPF